MTYDDLEFEWESPSEVIKCHTSGSTGVPTDIVLPKCQMWKSAERTVLYFNLNDSSHLHSCVSPDYIGGKMVLVRSKICSCTYSWEKPSNTPLENYSGPDIDLISVVPSQMIYILNNFDRMPVIRNFLIGGSQIPVSIKERIIELGLNAYESYGMTETSSHIAIRKISSEIVPFKTLEGISVEDYVGKLKINIDGWKSFVTNDCAEIFSETEFLIIGRADNIINSGGIKINPEQIEQRLSSQIKVPFVISSLPDEKWGERIVLVAEGEPRMINEISNTLDNVLSGVDKPKQVITLKNLPKTENGKVKRDEIRAKII